MEEEFKIHRGGRGRGRRRWGRPGWGWRRPYYWGRQYAYAYPVYYEKESPEYNDCLVQSAYAKKACPYEINKIVGEMPLEEACKSNSIKEKVKDMPKKCRLGEESYSHTYVAKGSGMGVL